MEQHALTAGAVEGAKKADAVRRFAAAKNQARQIVLRAADLTPIDDWLVDAIELWINLYMPGRLNLRIYPQLSWPEFQVIANLKRDCFVNDDIETLRLSYGSYPDIDLTIFGLITSLPPVRGYRFNPLPEFAGEHLSEDAQGDASASAPPDQYVDEELEDLAARRQFESGFRGVFGGSEGMERMVHFRRFPQVVVQPIAIYRRILLDPDVVVDEGNRSWFRRVFRP